MLIQKYIENEKRLEEEMKYLRDEFMVANE